MIPGTPDIATSTGCCAILRNWNAVIARFAGSLGDALWAEPGTLIAPIKDRPDFEHLEAKGLGVLKKLAARQRRRKKN